MCIRALLQVRNTTSTDICLIELGLPELSALVAQRQKVFFQRMSASRENIDDDPLIFAIHLCLASRTPTARHLNRLLESRNDEVRESKIRIQTRVTNSIETNTRNAWYLRANPELAVHQIYTARTHPVNEIHRVSWTRLRLSAHSLAIEEGRWNRRGRGRLPVEERLCQCGAVQDERHVLQHCPATQHLRATYGFSSVEEFFSMSDGQMCEVAVKLLNTYQ